MGTTNTLDRCEGLRLVPCRFGTAGLQSMPHDRKRWTQE